MKKVVILLFCALLFTATAYATHITHGNMYHQYIRTVGDKAEYKITVVMYRDCSASTVLFDKGITVGIYQNQSLISTKEISLVTSKFADFVSPTWSAGPFCLERAVYEGIIQLDTLSVITYVVFERCCRPAFTNILEDVGTTFFTQINPGLNNSEARAYNEDLLVTSIGIKTHFTLGHYNPEEDSLSYKLVAPVAGASSTDPIPAPKSTLGSFPPVQYRNGFSAKTPLGTNGYVILDSQNGRLQVYASTQGKYIVAYEVSEWRNGFLLNKYQREVAIYTINARYDSINNASTYAFASMYGNKQVAVSWSHAIKKPFSKFILQRAKAPDYLWTDIGSTETSVLYFSDTGIQYNIKYRYRVLVDIPGDTAIYGQESKDVIITDQPPLDIQQLPATAINLYPNPATGAFTINTHEEIKVIALLDVFGKQVYSEKIPGGTTAEIILPADIAPGMYMVQVSTESGIATTRIMKE